MPFTTLRMVDTRRVRFSRLKRIAIDSLELGTNAKLHMQFKRRIWTEQGYDGASYVQFPYEESWEVSAAQAGRYGILVGFPGGRRGVFQTAAHGPAPADLRATVRRGTRPYLSRHRTAVHWPRVPRRVGARPVASRCVLVLSRRPIHAVRGRRAAPRTQRVFRGRADVVQRHGLHQRRGRIRRTRGARDRARDIAGRLRCRRARSCRERTPGGSGFMIRDGIAAVRLTALACIASAALASCGAASRTQSGAFVPLAAAADAAPLSALRLPFARVAQRRRSARQDPARRHHHAGEPQLRRPVPGLSGRRHAVVRLRLERQHDHAPARSRSKARTTSTTTSTLHRRPTTAARWTASTSSRPAAGQRYTDPQYGYVPHSRDDSCTSTMANQYVLADRHVHVATSTTASSRTSTSSRHRRTHRRLPERDLGAATGERRDTIATLNQNRTFGPDDPGLLRTITTLGDELDARRTLVALLRRRRTATADLERLPGDQPHLPRPGLDADVIAPPTQFLTDVANGKLANVTWVTPTVRELRPRRLRQQRRARRGSRRSSTRSATASSGTRPRSSSCGTSGAAGTITSRRRSRLRRPRLPRPAADHLAVREARLRLARPVRARQHPALHRGQVRAGADGGERCARERPRRLEFSFTKPPRAFTPFETNDPPDYFMQQARMQRQSPPDDE